MRKHMDKEFEDPDFMDDFEGNREFDMERDPMKPGPEKDRGGASRRLPVFIGIALGIAAVILILLQGGGDKPAEEYLKGLNSKLEILNSKIARIDDIEKRITSLEDEVSRAAAKADNLGKRSGDLKKRLDAIEKKLAYTSSPETSSIPSAAKPKGSSGIRYHVVDKGETPYGIAKRYGLSVKQLFSLNKIGSNGVIKPGQKLVVSR